MENPHFHVSMSTLDPEHPHRTFFFGESPFVCNPDCLVQSRHSKNLPESRSEGASSLLGRGRESLKNVCCSRATSRLHRCKSGVALEQDTFSRLSGPLPKRLLAPSLLDYFRFLEFRDCARQSGLQPLCLVGAIVDHVLLHHLPICRRRCNGVFCPEGLPLAEPP